MLCTCWGVRQVDATRNQLYVENVKPRDFQPCGTFILEGRPHLDKTGQFKMLQEPGKAEELRSYLRQKGGRPSVTDKREKVAQAVELRASGVGPIRLAGCIVPTRRLPNRLSGNGQRNAPDLPNKTLYWMAAETGMRPGELAGLRLEDVNLEGLSVRVVQSVWAGKLQAPKNANAVRELAISPELAGHLRIYLSAWRPNPLKLLFASQNGTPLSSGNVWKRHLGPLLDKLGIKRRGTNAFRHTSACFMDRLNTPMTVRQERLGHAPGSPVTLAHYTHSVGEDNRKVADQMGAAWGMVN